MAAKTLQTNVVVSGKVKNEGFNDIKTKLEQALSLATQVSQALIDYGKESVAVYGTYEQNMADAAAAMKTAGTYVQSEFEQMNEAAQQWASTSIFTTGDVSKAIDDATHAGWSFEKIMKGIPQAMYLAQAGGMGLSEAVTMITQSANGAGIEFENLGDFIDYWVAASSASATDINGFGEAMTRMGKSMQFANSPQELMTMIALLANVGVTGSEAGTMLRNTMLRIAVPTTKATAILSDFGLTVDDITQDGASIEDTAAALESMGVSVYDSEGNLRSMQDIFTDMYEASQRMSEQDYNAAMGGIFGQRNIQAAMQLVEAAGKGEQGWNSYMTLLGQSTGAAKLYGETMMDTQVGTLAMLNSAYEGLQLKVGQQLSPLVEGVAGTITGMINSLTNMDPAGFEAIVTALGTFAGLSTTLGAAVAVVKTMGTLGVAGGLALFGLAAASATAGIVALNQALEEQRFEENFGEMNLDFEPVKQYLQGMSTEYEAAAGKISEFNAAVADAEEAYKKASANLSRDMYTILMTGGSVDQGTLETMTSYGEQMYAALIQGVENQYASETTFWQYLFGGKDNAQNNESYRTLMGALNTEYNAAIQQAASLDSQLRQQITSAWADGKLTEEERQKILATMDDYNAVMAEITAADTYAEQQELLRRAQGASWDSAVEMASEISGARDTALETLDKEFWRNYNRRKYYMMNDDDGMTDAEQAQLDALEAQYNVKRGEQAAWYNDTLFTMWNSVLNDSDLSDILKRSGEMIAEGMSSADIGQTLKDEFGIDAVKDMYQALSTVIQGYGGPDAMMTMARQMAASGDVAGAQNLMSIIDMYNSAAAAQMHMINGITGTGFYTSVGAHIDTTQMKGVFDQAQVQADKHPVQIPTFLGYPNVNPGTGGSGGNGYNYIKGLFAEGGRADSASIFGEAGAEWAIPEEHSLNTANLINQARAASGFSWSELMSSVGATASSGNQTFVYSPTIHAENADGVAQTLEADKKRMQKWWREMQMTERTVSYA